MLFSDDIDEILRAAAKLNTARQERDMEPLLRRMSEANGLAHEPQMRPAVEVAEEQLELAVRVAVERAPGIGLPEHAMIQREIERRGKKKSW